LFSTDTRNAAIIGRTCHIGISPDNGASTQAD
jgi:hypothetical protein